VLLLLDNHDSFTFNLAQYLGELGQEVSVVFADAVSVDEIAAMKPEHIVISPGPGTPNDAGISIECVRNVRVPILGVCLGHQAIGQAFGGRVVRTTPIHGKVCRVNHAGAGVFAGLPNPLAATRYHSLVVERSTLPAELEITAWSDDDRIMGLRHRELPIEGLQFHPESIGTPEGHALLRAFLER
jgi:anthranilate synthase component 2